MLFLPLDLAGDKMTGWKTGKQPKEEKKEKSLNKQTHARGRKIGKGGESSERRMYIKGGVAL